MTIAVEQLTNLLVDRMPLVPREALAALAEAVGEMCEEVRVAEREACAVVADSYSMVDGPARVIGLNIGHMIRTRTA